MFSSLVAFPFLLGASVLAQSSLPVLCVAGQCIQGLSNTTIGTRLSGASTILQLLPGQYTSTTDPQLLHQLLTSSSAALTPSPGFEQSSSKLSLPLNVALQPGIALYPQRLYSGQSTFTALPTTPQANTSTPLSAGSLALSSNVWVAVSTGTDRLVLWDSVPDISQLPLATSALSLLDIQSGACSPPCAGSSTCSAAGTCTCPAGFTGTSCDACASGFFGPSCQPCSAGCATCDDGIAGSGTCLKPLVGNAPDSCNCLNGVCGGSGQCTCNPGWVSSDNGTACAKCQPGFFLTSGGDCQICQLGCTQCADGTGACTACQLGFAVDAVDKTKCNPPQSTTSTGNVCNDGTFGSGGTCLACSSACKTCIGSASTCVVCADRTYKLGGSCVTADQNGVCQGSSLIADISKHECDACGAKCTKCRIPNFDGIATFVDTLECTGCLPGFVLSQGKCLASCPSGSFISSDNVTCATCDSTCGSCAGSSTFCLTCTGTQRAFNGKCVATCPSGSFASPNPNACTACHPDCTTCSGPGFNQCLSCPPDQPVLTSGRCLPTCSKSQFFNKASATCQSCDSSCSSCSGAGAGSCLGCASSTQVLHAGSCVASNCNGASNVIPGLGVCLSALVTSGSGTASQPPGINEPTRARPLAWWQILLMALGCAFIVLVVLMLWRRAARKKRAQQTAMFASAKSLDRKGWRWRLARFGERLFGHRLAARAGTAVGLGVIPASASEQEELKLMKLREEEEERHHREMEKIFGAYEYSRAGSSRRLSRVQEQDRGHARETSWYYDNDRRSNSQVSAPSLYSQITGESRRVAEPRLPARKNTTGSAKEVSRFSMTTIGSSVSAREVKRVPPPPMPTDAEDGESKGVYSSGSKNPFRI